MDLTVKCTAIRLPEENTGENLCDLGFVDEFSIQYKSMTPK